MARRIGARRFERCASISRPFSQGSRINIYAHVLRWRWSKRFRIDHVIEVPRMFQVWARRRLLIALLSRGGRIALLSVSADSDLFDELIRGMAGTLRAPWSLTQAFVLGVGGALAVVE